MKAYEITFDNGQIRTITVVDDLADPAVEIQKSIPLDSLLTGASIVTVQEI